MGDGVQAAHSQAPVEDGRIKNAWSRREAIKKLRIRNLAQFAVSNKEVDDFISKDLCTKALLRRKKKLQTMPSVSRKDKAEAWKALRAAWLNMVALQTVSEERQAQIHKIETELKQRRVEARLIVAAHKVREVQRKLGQRILNRAVKGHILRRETVSAHLEQRMGNTSSPQPPSTSPSPS